MKRLVVTADDFGRAVEVNEAVEEAFTRGVVTATSLMVAEPLAGDAVARAKRLQGLRACENPRRARPPANGPAPGTPQ